MEFTGRVRVGLRGEKAIFRVRGDDWAALRGRSRGDWVWEPLARPLFRESWKEDMTEQEAEKLLKSALLSCVMRDKMMMNKFQLSKVTADGPGEISSRLRLKRGGDTRVTSIRPSSRRARGKRKNGSGFHRALYTHISLVVFVFDRFNNNELFS